MGVPGAQSRSRKGPCAHVRSTRLSAAVDSPSSTFITLDCVEDVGSLRGGAWSR